MFPEALSAGTEPTVKRPPVESSRAQKLRGMLAVEDGGFGTREEPPSGSGGEGEPPVVVLHPRRDRERPLEQSRAGDDRSSGHRVAQKDRPRPTTGDRTKTEPFPEPHAERTTLFVDQRKIAVREIRLRRGGKGLESATEMLGMPEVVLIGEGEKGRTHLREERGEGGRGSTSGWGNA